MLVVCALLATVAGQAQTYDQIAPKEPARATGTVTVPTPAAAALDTAQLDRVLVPHLRGLVFVGEREAFQPAGLTTSDIALERLPLLDAGGFRAAMQRYLGQPLTVRQLNALTREVVLYFREHNRPIVDVLVPEQNVSSGTVQVLVIQGRLGRVQATGNKYYADRHLVGAVRSRPGEVIDSRPLLADIMWLNQNPFRQVDLVYARGQNPGETDVILRTTERYPLRAYVGYEDSGNALTGYDRVQAGLNWGNAFGQDQLLNYQLSGSPDFRKLIAHSASYVAPVPRLRHTLVVFGSFAESEPALPGGFFTLEGRTWQLSGRYRIPLAGRGALVHEITAGIDFKRSNNDLAFGGASVFAQETDVVQAVLGYTVSRPASAVEFAFDAQLALSPGGLAAGNRTRAFRGARSGAQPDYAYLRLELERTQKLPGEFRWSARGAVQVATSNLLGSEQLGLGGSQSLRGYEEREANGDNGLVIANQLHAPALRPALRLWHGGPSDRLDPYVFFDYGFVASHARLPGEPDRLELASAGLGFRYNLGTRFNLRLDYGWQLKSSGVSDGRRSSRAHVGATLSY